MIYYDHKINGFLDSSLHVVPGWAVSVTESKRDELLAGVSSSKTLGSDKSGNPVLVDVAPVVIPASVLLERVKGELRTMRAPILSAVTGIGWEASESDDAALVQEARKIRNALRDITDDPALNAAQTYEEMRAAGIDAFRRIASAASNAFSATFREFK